jgi:phage FluMu protein Com
MHADSAKTSQLTGIARELGAEILEGKLRFPSRTGGWQLGDVDLGNYLARYRDQGVVIVLVPLATEETQPVTCDVCGYVMDATDDECPRCKLIEEYTTDVERRIREREQLFEDVE